jgi:hypothetical protein
MSDEIYLVVGWSIEESASLEDAKREAWYRVSGDNEYDWFDHIEIVSPDGSSVKLFSKDIPEFAVWDAQQQASYANRLQAVANISLDNKVLDWFYDMEQARAEYARLLPYLGDRVKIKLL